MRQKIFTEEEIRQHKKEYMKNTKWFCDICNKNCNITSKTNHLKSNIHNRNIQLIEKDLLIADLRNKLSKKQ